MLKLYPTLPETPSPTQEREKEADGSLRFFSAKNKLHFISLGCPRNRVDTEVMLGILLQKGFEVTGELEAADYIVINTCGFLEAAREESKDTIASAMEAKKDGAKLIVTGCMVQTRKEEIRTAFPEVDYLLGSGDVENILNAVLSEEKGEVVSSRRSYLEMGEVPRTISTGSFAYLKIAEGCRKACAYCIIPKIKGPLRSKSKEQIVKEFHTLLNHEIQEVILIAQDLGDFGKDAGFKRSDGLVDLLKTMGDTDRAFWLRLLYLYPDEITDELIATIKNDPRICRYIDMPIQHVNNRILKSMGRHTSKEEIVETIQKLRAALPDLSLRTSLIVGFPGETEEDFEELVEFVRENPIEHVGIFKFSREEGSRAYAMEGQIDEEVKERRWKKLLKIQKKTSKKLNARFVGKTIPCLIEGYHPESKLLLVGRHQGQCPDIDGQVLINDARGVKAFGKVYNVLVTEALDYDLVGRVVS